MVSRIRGAAAWVAGVFLLIGCSSATGPRAASPAPPSPATIRDAAILYVPPPGAAGADGVGEPLEIRSNPGAVVVNDAIWQRSIASHAHLITHPSNLLRTLVNTRSGVPATKWYARHASPEDALAWLQQHFTATPVPGTALIELSIAGDVDRAEAAVIINAIATQYLEGDRTRELDKLVEQIDLYTNLKTRYEQRARTSRTESSNLAARLQVDGMGRSGLMGQKEQELQLLTVERLKEAGKLTDAESALSETRKLVEAGVVPSAVEVQLTNDWELINLRGQLEAMRLQAAAAANAGAQVEAMERELKERMAEKRAMLTDAHTSNLQGHRDAARARVELLSKQIAESQHELAELGSRLADYLNRRDEETAYRDLARRYSEQLDRLNVTRQRISPGQVIFAARAGEQFK